MMQSSSPSQTVLSTRVDVTYETVITYPSHC
jgi:hypothetical protein